MNRSLNSFVLSVLLVFSFPCQLPAETLDQQKSLSELDFTAFGDTSESASAGTDDTLEALINLDALNEEVSLDELMKVEVTVASTKGNTVFNTPSTVTIIDSSTIRKYNFQSVAEAVRTVAGFDISRTYLKRSIPTARGILQAHYANKVLVMINNVPTWHAVTGEANLERVNIHDVKQIEVLKGPASVKYGTNAYSGAINIVLKAPGKKRAGQYYLATGTDGRKEVGINVSMPSEKGNATDQIFTNFQGYDGYDYDYTGEAGGSAVIQEFIENSNLTWFHKSGNASVLANIYDGAESYLGVTPKIAAGAGIDHELSGRLVNYTYDKKYSEKTSLKFSGTYDWNERTVARNISDASDVTGYRLTGGLLLSRTPSDDANFELGFDYDERTSKSYRNYVVATNENLGENNLNDKSLAEYSFFGSYNWQGSSVNGSAGIRWTDNEEFGTNSSFNLSLVKPLAENKCLKLIFAQSFRTPSLFELNFETGSGTVFGNLDLEPETSDSIELAFIQKKGSFFFQTTLYKASYDNKILRTRGDGISPSGVAFTDKTHYVNGEEFSAVGLDFEARFHNPKARGINGILNLSYVDGEDDDRIVDGTDTEVYNFLSVPDFTAMIGIDKQIGDEISASMAANYRTSCRDTEGTRIGSVTTVDFNLRHRKPKSNSFIDLAIKNLFDNEALIPEYARPGSDVDAVPGIGYGREIIVSYTRKF